MSSNCQTVVNIEYKEMKLGSTLVTKVWMKAISSISVFRPIKSIEHDGIIWNLLEIVEILAA